MKRGSINEKEKTVAIEFSREELRDIAALIKAAIEPDRSYCSETLSSSSNSVKFIDALISVVKDMIEDGDLYSAIEPTTYSGSSGHPVPCSASRQLDDVRKKIADVLDTQRAWSVGTGSTKSESSEELPKSHLNTSWTRPDFHKNVTEQKARSAFSAWKSEP